MLAALRRRRISLDASDARALLRHTFSAHPEPRFAFRLWNGEVVDFASPSGFTVSFADRETFRRCFATCDPAQLAEAYVDGRVEVEGDLLAAAGLASYLGSVELGLRDKLRFAPRLVVPASTHSRDRDRRDVRAHYDLGDDFFQLFLDEKMVYSCGYFKRPEQSLERAQERKLELICRKLRLRPDERFLDIGCGWGALAIWAARRHAVRAHGITLSENQAAEARRRAAAAGVADRVTIELRHYADLEAGGFDKIASVGMYEHVGLVRLPAYLRAVRRALRPGGRFLNHGITERPSGKSFGGAFVFRNVFPGAELASAGQLLMEMERTGFRVLGVQSIGPHYALTLREWFRRFRARRDEAARFVPERVLRTWDLYLAGCSHAFAEGLLDVHQVLASTD